MKVPLLYRSFGVVNYTLIGGCLAYGSMERHVRTEAFGHSGAEKTYLFDCILGIIRVDEQNP